MTFFSVSFLSIGFLSVDVLCRDTGVYHVYPPCRGWILLSTSYRRCKGFRRMRFPTVSQCTYVFTGLFFPLASPGV